MRRRRLGGVLGGVLGALPVLVVLAAGTLAEGCSGLKLADTTSEAGPGDLDAMTGDVGPPLPDAGQPDVLPSSIDTVTLPLEDVSIITGSLSLVADANGDVAVAWLDTPSTERHLHIAAIAGGETAPRLKVQSDTMLESGVNSLGQAVAAFSPATGCFGVAWGQGGQLLSAAVGAAAKPGPSSVLAAISMGALPRLSQVRATRGAADHELLAWSEVARYSGDAPGVFHSLDHGFVSCQPGGVVQGDTLSDGNLSYQPAPAGAPELAVAARSGAKTLAALQAQASASSALALEARPQSPPSGWDPPVAIGTPRSFASGGSVALAPNADGFVVAYYRHTSSTLGDLVAVPFTGVMASEQMLEHDIQAGFAPATYLEIERLAVASGPNLSPVIAAVFARDGTTSELRIYRTDPTAPSGYRSQLLDSDVMGPSGGADAHALVDVAIDGSNRIHVAWRSGKTKAVKYARLLSQ